MLIPRTTSYATRPQVTALRAAVALPSGTRWGKRVPYPAGDFFRRCFSCPWPHTAYRFFSGTPTRVLRLPRQHTALFTGIKAARQRLDSTLNDFTPTRKLYQGTAVRVERGVDVRCSCCSTQLTSHPSDKCCFEVVDPSPKMTLFTIFF